MTLRETMPEQLPSELTYDSLGEAAEAYELTGNFTSQIPTEVGPIPNSEAISEIASAATERLLTIDAGVMQFANGGMEISNELVEGDWSEADIAAVRTFETALLMIDADFRQRAGIDASTVLQPNVTITAGIYDEQQARSNAVPHLDQYGEKTMLYFAAVGAGTRVYPGEFFVDPSVASSLDPEKAILTQIEEKGIAPVELDGDKIYAAGWNTVHASPDETHVDEQRCFLRVTYAPYSIHDQTPVLDTVTQTAPDETRQLVNAW